LIAAAKMSLLLVLYRVFSTTPPHFQYQEVLSQWGALLIFLKGSSSWLLLFPHFGTENWEE